MTKLAECDFCGQRFPPGGNPHGLAWHACDRRPLTDPPSGGMSPKQFVRELLALTLAAVKQGSNDMELDLAGRAQLVQAASAAHERFGNEDDETEKELERFLGPIEAPGVEVEDEGDVGGTLEEADPGDPDDLGEAPEPVERLFGHPRGGAGPTFSVVDRRGAQGRPPKGAPGGDDSPRSPKKR